MDPEADVETRAKESLIAYTKHSKGFVTTHHYKLRMSSQLTYCVKVKENSDRAKEHNKKLVNDYGKDPRLFFKSAQAEGLDKSLVEYALYTHSIRPASSKSESDFSRQGALLSKRRLGYTVPNMSSRMITSNLLAQKRKLVDECEKNGLGRKRQKLSGNQYAKMMFK